MMYPSLSHSVKSVLELLISPSNSGILLNRCLWAVKDLDLWTHCSRAVPPAPYGGVSTQQYSTREGAGIVYKTIGLV